MPFRSRLKRVFGRSPPDSSSELSTTASDPSRTTDKKRARKESHERSGTYRAGEMPKPKYGGPVNKEHQKTLKAFQWPSDTWRPRRQSQQSQYSPTASKPTSRMNSFRRKSMNPKSRRPSSVDPAMRERVDEVGDVTNVGKSREPPPNEPQPWPSDATESKPLHGATAYANGHPLRNSSPDRRLTALSDHQFGTPFTAEELTKAVTDTGLRPTVLAS